MWFDHQAEEAANYYVAAFTAACGGDSTIANIVHYNKALAEAAGKGEGAVLTADFRLEGVNFVALNAVPFCR